MTASLPDEFLAAFDRVWQLPANMGKHAIGESNAFKHFRETVNNGCYADVSGMFAPFNLLDGLQRLGVPCFFTDNAPLAATHMAETADRCYQALMKAHVQVTYLCPLDWAGCLPQVSFDNVAIRDFNSAELDALLNTQEQQRHPWFKPVGTSQLSQFSWLVVGETLALPKRFDDRYMSWPQWHTNRDAPGTVYPYNHHYPEAVDRAIFMLMLAPWEENLGVINTWRPFDIPWVYTIYEDIFYPQRTIPSADSLTWTLRTVWNDELGYDEEYPCPAERNNCITEKQLTTVTNRQVRRGLERAINCGLINAAARHQFVKGFRSDSVDAFLAHIVVIDACLGEDKPDTTLEKQLVKLKSTGRLKYRLAGLLDDASVVEDMDTLYKTRNNYVHGNNLEKISAKNVLQARTLARKTLSAIILLADQFPTLTRQAFLNDVLRKGWKRIKDDRALTPTNQKTTLKDVFELIQVCIEAKPQVSDRAMRSMITHVFSSTLKPYTVFTGNVSAAAVRAIEEMNGIYQGHKVVREHPERIQANITQLIGQMRYTDNWDFEKFEEKVEQLSNVNITTFKENSALRKKGASYENLGIKLIPWEELSIDVRRIIRKSLLTSVVSNRAEWPVD